MTTLFERLGGEPALRAIIDDFVDRTFDDMMIGFMFRSASRERVKRFEYQLAASVLGSGDKYRGKPIAEAHRRHRIMGGQFARRREILRQVLVRHEAPPEVVQAWLKHTDTLRPLVTADVGSECSAQTVEPVESDE